MERIYHATRNLEGILTCGALESLSCQSGKDEVRCRHTYERACCGVATFVKAYHAREGSNVQYSSDERLATLAGDSTFSWSSNQIEAERLLGIEKQPDFRSDQKYEQLIRRIRRFNALIRNCYVYCGSAEFAANFGKGVEGTKTLLGIATNVLSVKTYLHAGALVWWRIPLEGRLREIHSEHPSETRRILRKCGRYNNVEVLLAEFPDQTACLPF